MTAEQHEPAEPRRIRDRTRPAMLPDSFTLLVVGR